MSRVIIVCEPKPYWTPELQRRFLGERVTVRGCRKWSVLVELSREYPSAMRIVEFAGVARECLVGMTQAAASPHHQPLLLLVNESTAELEWVLREGGADSVVSDQITADELIRLCRGWLSN